MLLHYLKVAVRNLLKYKTQSVISIVGLAIGLATFTLSAFWVRYEMTFDTFHRDAERMYLVGVDISIWGRQYEDNIPYSFGEHYQQICPEIEDWCMFTYSSNMPIQKEKSIVDIPCIYPDSTFLNMMDIRILEGNPHFYLERQIALTERMAMDFFGTTQAIGKEIDTGNGNKMKVGAIVSDWGIHSNYPYQFLSHFLGSDNSYSLLIKVRKGTDINALTQKMNENLPATADKEIKGFFIVPLTKLHYDKGYVGQNGAPVKYEHIVYFSITGVLIILCALINYLSICVDRFRTRRKEMGLRKVCGASGLSLYLLLATELLITILISAMVGMVLVECLLESFMNYASIGETRNSVYVSCILYSAGSAVLIFVVTLIGLLFLQRYSLQSPLQAKSSGNYFRKGSLIIQLVCSLFFITSTALMQMQIHHLRYSDTGMDYQCRGAASLWMNVDMNVWHKKIAELPMIEETVEPKYWPLLSMGAGRMREVTHWDGLDKPLEEPFYINDISAGEDLFDFYNMELLSGRWITESSKGNEVVITESTAKRFGWTAEEAVGKQFYSSVENLEVIGVMKDCAYKSPTERMPYTAFYNTYQEKWSWGRAFVLFKYKPGTWEECRKRIEQMQQAEEPNKKLFIFSEEEKYNEYLKSEDALSTLLGFASLVCILISVFGIYSLVTLTCQYRRKEIAIRKVNGAQMSDILRIFSKEYALMLVVASIIAFPTAYWVMKQWIQTYNRQVEIGILPFAIIFIGITLVITISIGHRVWKAANENPADVVKSE